MPDRVVVVVLRRHLSDWGLSEDELFRLGTEQARRHETVRPELIDLGEGMSFHTIRGNSFLVSANALWLEEYIEPAGRGALVALPNRHEVLFHEIKSLEPLVRTHDALAKMFATCSRRGRVPSVRSFTGGALAAGPIFR